MCTNLGAWLTLVLIPKGIVVLFGTFMAWQTRKVYIRQLNDTQHCAVCMIAICVCSFIGLVCAFTVARYPSTYYGVIGSLVFLSTTIILVWLFAHKVSKYLLLYECEVRTASYGPSFFLPFMAQVRSARAMKTRKERTRICNLPYGPSKRG